MGEARHTILVKSAQMQRINHYFQHDQMMDTVNIIHFAEPDLVPDYFKLLEQ